VKRAVGIVITTLQRWAERATPRRWRTLRQFVPVYMKELAVNKCVDVARIMTALNRHILPMLGDRRLRSLKREDGIDYIAHRRDEGAAEGTIEREWAVLMRVLNLAVQNEDLDKNRLESVPSPKGARREQTWSVEDLDAMRETVAKGRNRRDREARADVVRMLDVAVNTGLRLARVLGIERQACVIEADGWWLTLPSARTKTKGNPRLIPLNGPAVDALGLEKADQPAGRVFSRWKNGYSFRAVWNRMRKDAGLQGKDLRFHDLRGTFSTLLQDLGFAEEIRGRFLGHAESMTGSYSHGGRGHMREAVTRLEALLRGNVRRLVLSGENRNRLRKLVPRDRIELSTPAFSGLCSAN